MIAAIRSCWALLLGIALIMLGNGLQGTLLGLRATIEGFPSGVTGAVMTGYFAGFVAGSTIVPRLVRNVGHVRVFAALASMASVSALLHPVFVSPLPWLGMRLLTGFCFAGLYVVAESWLNEAASNETRGQLISVYMVISLGGMGAGQLLLNVSDPAGFELFVLVSVLVSIALVPILLTAVPAPRFDEPATVGWRSLYAASPLGLVGGFGTGIAFGAIFGMGAVYANGLGLPVNWVSWLMAGIVLGGMLLQWPIGRWSDLWDRRGVIAATSLAAAVVAAACAFAGAGDRAVLLVLLVLFGGLSLPLYSLCIAHTNDHLTPPQMVAASATLVLVTGAGASLGPVACGLLMEAAGPAGYPWFLAAVHAGIGGFALWRVTRRPAPAREDQLRYPAFVPRTSTVVAAVASRTVRDARDRDIARSSGL